MSTSDISTNTTGAVLLMPFCNIFGGENDGGAKRVLGGIGDQRPARQWYCENRSIGRFRMRCFHGHQGQIMQICEKHLNEFRTAATFCPRCQLDTPHKCRLKIQEVS